jgi:hypothetical protein
MVKPFLIFSACLCTAICADATASASVFAIFSLDDQLSYSVPGNPGLSGKEQVSDQVVPFEQTASISSGSGGTITSTYKVTDNGTVAVFGITTAGSIVGPDEDLDESGGFNPPYTRFSFSMPVICALSVSVTAGGSGAIDVEGGPATLQYANLSPGTAINATGLLLPNVPYSFVETYDLGDVGYPAITSLSGGESFTLTFTAVPEPTSAAMLLLFSFAAHGRARRRPAAGVGIVPAVSFPFDGPQTRSV